MSAEERIAVLETQMRHMERMVDETHDKVKDLHDIFMQAKGARWVLIATAAAAGAMASFISNVLPWFGVAPK